MSRPVSSPLSHITPYKKHNAGTGTYRQQPAPSAACHPPAPRTTRCWLGRCSAVHSASPAPGSGLGTRKGTTPCCHATLVPEMGVKTHVKAPGSQSDTRQEMTEHCHSTLIPEKGLDSLFRFKKKGGVGVETIPTDM